MQIEHTHNKTHYAVVIGRVVQFFSRPQSTKKKGYREPLLVDKKRYPSKEAAKQAKLHWEGKLI